MAAALDLIRSATLPAAMAPGDCLDTNIVKTDLKNDTWYQPDSTSSGSICVISSAQPCSELDASIEVGAGSVYLYTLWDMRIQGQTPDGAVQRVQATAQRCTAYN